MTLSNSFLFSAALRLFSTSAFCCSFSIFVDLCFLLKCCLGGYDKGVQLLRTKHSDDMAKVAADIFAHYYISGRNTLCIQLIVSNSFLFCLSNITCFLLSIPFSLSVLFHVLVESSASSRDIQLVTRPQEDPLLSGFSQQPQEL